MQGTYSSVASIIPINNSHNSGDCQNGGYHGTKSNQIQPCFKFLLKQTCCIYGDQCVSKLYKLWKVWVDAQLEHVQYFFLAFYPPSCLPTPSLLLPPYVVCADTVWWWSCKHRGWYPGVLAYTRWQDDILAYLVFFLVFSKLKELYAQCCFVHLYWSLGAWLAHNIRP